MHKIHYKQVKSNNMKQYIKLVMALLLLAVSATQVAEAKSNTPKKTIYAFAYGTNFNDSTAYISAITALPNVQLEPKTKFLQSRSQYALQLKQYLEKNYGGHFMCAVLFNTKKDKLEKRYVKMRRSAANKKANVRLVEIPVTDFTLKPVIETEPQQ